ncbi:MAG TPA: N-methyl-D-aspartate receptor NMDAR2C subunit [Phycisphaerae bacterium]|nr:N-methyl-D-aspartate receptor NMDAR2C subunit [Phycisphaerae bacterium]
MDEAAEFRWRWEALWRGRAAPPPAVPDQLLALYGEAHRAYHNVTHVLACLKEAEAFFHARSAAASFPIIAALFFHDAIYDPQRPDNEAASAQLAYAKLTPFVTAEERADIDRLIRVTEHKAPPARPDEEVVVDIDLSILGQPPAIFDAYEQAIRKEYGFVTDDAFRKGRAAILRRFLARPGIFATDCFRGQYEAQSRVNLTRSLQILESHVPEPP